MATPPLHSFLTRRALILVGLPGWCFALVALRFLRTGHPGFRFLVWNLCLAIVPALAATLLVRAERRHASSALRATWFVLWLLFLPNAPYIVTDFVHLHERPPAPLWFDIALMVSFACAGLLLCFASLADVQDVVVRRFGAAWGWSTVVLALMLSGLGVYLGRFLRWNSWDTLVRPHELMAQIGARLADPLGHSRALLVTLIYGGGLIVGYVAVRAIAPHPGPRLRPPGE